MLLEINSSLKLNIESPAITSIFKNENTEIGLNVIKVLVDRFADSFGFSTKMSASQSETMCIDTFDNFKGESLGDIILFFKMARNGSFGTTHRGIDSNLIFGDWFPKYLMLKSEEREKQYLKQKQEQIKPELSIEDVHKAYEKEKNRDKLEQVKNFVDKITNGITRDHLEELISQWSIDPKKNEYIRVLKAKRLTIK